MVEKVHEHGALAGIQLGYNGSGTNGLDTRIASRGVEQVPNDAFVFHSCYTMTKREIRELQGFYVAAALRAKRVGFDIIQLSASHGAGLAQQFLMPRYNHRTDEYGGSLANRCRFLVEVLEGIREAVHDECAVTVRFCIETPGDPTGISPETTAAAITAADHLVDLWDVEVSGPSRPTGATTPCRRASGPRATRWPTWPRSAHTRRSRSWRSAAGSIPTPWWRRSSRG